MGVVDWIYLAHDKENLGILMNIVMIPRVLMECICFMKNAIALS